MDVSLLRETLLSPPVLSFALGAGAAFARSDLEVPQPIAKFLSLYLMFAIGIHGGHGLHETGLSVSIALMLLAAMGVFQNCYLMAVCTPDIAARIVEMIRPILKSYGGIALVSDCLWVKH